MGDPDSVLVGKPDGSGIDLGMSTERAAEIISDPSSSQEQIERALKVIQENMD